MKTTFSLLVALATLTSVRAQILRPEAVSGAVLGGAAGAVIGNNSGDLRHSAGKGAAIGAGAGLILGQAAGNANASVRNPAVESSRNRGYVERNHSGVPFGLGYRG